jgi:hypothetical protein
MRSRRVAARKRFRRRGLPAPRPLRGRSARRRLRRTNRLPWRDRRLGILGGAGLVAAGVAFLGAPDFPAALAFFSAARRLVAAMILARPSGSGGVSSRRPSQARASPALSP